MGPMKWSETLMLLVFGLVAISWIRPSYTASTTPAVAMLGISVLLITGVLDWEDLDQRESSVGRVHLVRRTDSYG